MVQTNTIRVRLAVAMLVNTAFIIIQANMAAGPGPATNYPPFPIHSESVPRCRSKASIYRNAGKKIHLVTELMLINVCIIHELFDIPVNVN